MENLRDHNSMRLWVIRQGTVGKAKQKQDEIVMKLGLRMVVCNKIGFFCVNVKNYWFSECWGFNKYFS